MSLAASNEALRQALKQGVAQRVLKLLYQALAEAKRRAPLPVDWNQLATAPGASGGRASGRQPPLAQTPP